jgi:hypothetical protein
MYEAPLNRTEEGRSRQAVIWTTEATTKKIDGRILDIIGDLSSRVLVGIGDLHRHRQTTAAVFE